MKRVYTIKGMMCQHCVNSVKQSISKIDEIDKVEVNLEENSATIKTKNDQFDDSKVLLAVSDAGYEASVRKDFYKSEKFYVKGMMCDHCKNKVISSLSSLDGVYSIDVSLENGTANVAYNSQKIDSEKLIEAINNAGYKASLMKKMKQTSEEKAEIVKKNEKKESESKIKKEKFDISGMSCAACQKTVTKAVSKIKGVKSVNVNLLSNNMICEYDEESVDERQITKAVKNAGYNAVIHRESESSQLKRQSDFTTSYPSEKIRLYISIPILLLLMYISMGNMVGLPTLPIFEGSENAITFAFSQFLLTLPICFVNRKFFTSGFKSLFRGNPNMDSLVAIGSSAAMIYGIAGIFAIGVGLGNSDFELVQKYSSNLYFETAAMILTLVTLGKFLEAKSKRKTNSAIDKLMNLTPKYAKVIREGEEIEIPVKDILVGDIVSIYPGDSIPVDGIVVEGETSVDESAISGESIPVDKTISDPLTSASINLHGFVKFKAEKVGKDTAIAKIIELIENANSSKAPISRLADKVAGVFVPIVISLSLITLVVWLALGYSLEFSLNNAIGVLVISCPCALGLATPVAITVGNGRAAARGILIKSSESLEELKKVNTVILDKTGTITEGKPKVDQVISYNIDEEELIKIASSLEAKSEHPLAKAIASLNKEREFYRVEKYLTMPGMGVKGTIENREYYIGKMKLMKDQNVNVERYSSDIDRHLNMGQTPVYISLKEELLGVVFLSDKVKNDSLKAIEDMRASGLKVIMMTGDNEITARAISKRLNIDKYFANVLPSDKENKVKILQDEGNKVAMVGDGINDSPALTRANVGIAIGSGTDIAIDSADVVLVNDKLSSVNTAIKISRYTVKNIKENLFWALFYNVISIPIAAGMLYPAFSIGLSPMIGAACMSVSSIFVTLNALRLKYKKIR